MRGYREVGLLVSTARIPAGLISAGLIAAALQLVVGSPAHAAVPLNMPLQGVLRDNAANPVADGAFEVAFAIYDGAGEGASPVWEETWTSAAGDCAVDATGCLAVTDGVFAIQLGSQTPMTPAMFAGGAALWLGMSVEGEPELPRQPLGSTAFAFHAESASSLACTGCVAIEQLSDDTRATLAADAVAAVEDAGLGGALPPDGIAAVSNGLLSNQFVDTYASEIEVPIPDNFPPGVSSEITVADRGTAQGLTVSVEVVNSDLATVTVVLWDPDNTPFILHDEAPGTELIATFPTPTPTLSGDLTSWVDRNPAGQWRLEVIDIGFFDNELDGAIVGWSIEVQTLSTKKIAATGNVLFDQPIRLPLAAEAPFPCSAEALGFAYFDTTKLSLEICIDGEYQSVASGVCGDGKVQGAEDCDDAGALNGDGCNAACKIEPGFNCTGEPSSCTAPSCKHLRDSNPALGDGDYLIDLDGGLPDNAITTYCNMSSPHAMPDYMLITPDQFYHSDDGEKYGPTNGTNVFVYNCDACAAAQGFYTYQCPDEHWEVSFYGHRSHCNHSTHTGASDGVFTSETFTGGDGVEGVRFRQTSDGCGDPNEFTAVGVCRLKGTPAPDPGTAVWEGHFRDVSWSN